LDNPNAPKNVIVPFKICQWLLISSDVDDLEWREDDHLTAMVRGKYLRCYRSLTY
jgi:hypothetical protein